MAGLTWRGTDAATIAATFVREGQMTSKRALRQMRRVSKIILDQSIANTPVDWKGYTAKDPPGHELERSQRIEESYGAAGRIEATIMVGGMVGDVDVDLYAEWIHEGFYQLGPASVAKQSSTPGADVGPHFLERALQKHEHEFDALMDDLLQGLLL